MKPTLSQYLKGFATLRSLFAAIPFVPPLVHACVSGSGTIAEYFYPPLGDVQPLATAVTVGFLLLSIFAVFYCCRAAQKIRPTLFAYLIAGATFGICALIALYIPYVRRIEVPSVGLEVPVSIGYQRTDFALKTYPQWTDWAMLHDRGPQEEQIQKLWTRQSIIVVRILLWLAYSSILVCGLSIVNIGAYQHAAEELHN